MDLRNRIGLYGSYFLGMAGIGFTLPYLPLFLGEEGLTDRAIGIISTLAALAGLLQFPIGLWSDRVGHRKPFLIAALALLAIATFFLATTREFIRLVVLVLLFAENGLCRATVESLAGAEATQLANPSQVGAALGALRFWKPISIVLVALAAGMLAEQVGVAAALLPLAAVQGLAVVAALLIHESHPPSPTAVPLASPSSSQDPGAWLRDRTLWCFVAAMVLFHVANAPGGVYLGLFMKRQLDAPQRYLAFAFVVSMGAWMLVVRPAGRWADCLGRRPVLILAWAAMTLRLLLVTFATAPWQVLGIQLLDGVANGLFAVVAAAWMTDRLRDPRRAGTAQVLVGTSLVFGSALGPLLACLVVEELGYRGMFALLAGIGGMATAIIVLLIPETVGVQPTTSERESLVESVKLPLILEEKS